MSAALVCQGGRFLAQGYGWRLGGLQSEARAAELGGGGDNEENSRQGWAKAGGVGSGRVHLVAPTPLTNAAEGRRLPSWFSWPRCSQVLPPSTTIFLFWEGGLV